MEEKTKSYLNLTTSALSGVFGSTTSLAELEGDVNPSSPNFRSAARRKVPASSLSSNASLQTRAEKANHSFRRPRTSQSAFARIPFSSKAIFVSILFAAGVVYGQFARTLHDNHQVTTFILAGDKTVQISALWGLDSVLMGVLLPVLDHKTGNQTLYRGKGGSNWTSIVRSIAAFLGIAYGVQKLKWDSTLQAAFYMAMLNPCLWGLLDATFNGFVMSSTSAILGAVVFAVLIPGHLPTAALSMDYCSVLVWLSSVLFCSSICFGNLGRRLLTTTSY